MEFLFENPLLIFILVGIISSLFKKKKGEEEQQKSRPRPAQTVRPNSEPTPEVTSPRPIFHSDIPEATRDDVPSTISDYSSENQLSDIQKKYEEWKQERNVNTVDVVHKQSKDNAAQHVPESASIQLKPTPDKLVEGMAWAQIIGPPRAKNPHRFRKR